MAKKINDKNVVTAIMYAEIISVAVIFCLCSSKVFQVGNRDLLAFTIFEIIGLVIPGFAVSLLLDVKITIIERLCLAYSLGYALNIVEYFVEELLNRVIPYFLFQGIVCALSLLFIICNKERVKYCISESKSDNVAVKEKLVFFTTLLVLLLFNIFGYACHYKDTFNIAHDLSWWINNSVALKLKFPPDNLFMSDTSLFYHYFSSVQIAYSSLVTGINIVDLSVPFYAFTKTLVMTGATFFMLNVIGVKGLRKTMGVVIVLFSTGMEPASIITYFHHIFLQPFGFDIDYAFGMFFVSFLLLQYRKENLNLNILFLTLLTWAVCTGSKAPVAAVLILLPGLLCLFWLIKSNI